MTLLASGGLASELSDGSVFDQFLTRNKGVVPYPIKELKDRLQEFARKDGGPFDVSVVMIPNGRSRQKSGCDFKQPRVLLGIVPPLDTDPTRRVLRNMADRIFFGYSERRNELEVISWNNFQGKFEFRTVTNYDPPKAGKQKITGNVSHQCIICHQAGGPIFSASPWSESNMNAVGSPFERSAVSEALIGSVGSSRYKGLEIDAVAVDASEEIQARVLAAADYDRMVESANQLSQIREIAAGACGADLNCRSEYLKSILHKIKELAVKGFGPTPSFLPDKKFVEMFNALISRTWPSTGFSYPSHQIPDRDPFVGAAQQISGVNYNPASRREARGHLNIEKEEKTTDFLAARVTLQDGFEGMGFFFKDLTQFQDCTDSEFDSILASGDFARLVGEWPINSRSAQGFVSGATLRESVLALLENSCKNKK